MKIKSSSHNITCNFTHHLSHEINGHAKIARSPQAWTVQQPMESGAWSVEDMLQALEAAQKLDPQGQGAAAGQPPVPELAQASAVQLAKETLMAVGYNMPMRSRDRDRCATFQNP